MKAGEYIMDDGVEVYCSDIEKGVYCPWTGIFVSIMDVCEHCKNHHLYTDYHHYCLRGSAPQGEGCEGMVCPDSEE